MVDYCVLEAHKLQDAAAASLLLCIEEFWVNDRINLTLVVGVHERGYTLCSHYELIKLIARLIQILTRLIQILPKPLSNKRQETPISQPQEERVLFKRGAMNTHNHSSPQ